MNNLIILEYIKYIENKYSQGKKFKSKILDCIQDENFKYYSNEDIKKELEKPIDINYINEKNVRELARECHSLNIPMRIHADEFNDNNGGEIPEKYKVIAFCKPTLVNENARVY